MDKKQNGFFKNFNVTKYAKLFMAVSLAIAVLGAVMIGIFRFNLAYQYRGGNKITVQVEKLSDKALYGGYKTSIKDIIQGLTDEDGEPYNLTVRSSSLDISKGKFETADSLIFTTKLSEKQLEEKEPLDAGFLERLNKALGEQDFKSAGGVAVKVEAMWTEYTAPVDFADAFVNPLGFLILAAGLLCVWFAFRYSIKDALIALYILFSDAVILLALLALTRIPFNINLLALFAVMTAQSVIALVFLFDKIKTSRGTPGYTNLDEAGTAQAGFSESFKKNLLVFGVSCIAALSLLIGTTDTMLFAVAAFVSVLTGALNAVFVAPAVYSMFKESKKPVKKAAPKN